MHLDTLRLDSTYFESTICSDKRPRTVQLKTCLRWGKGGGEISMAKRWERLADRKGKCRFSAFGSQKRLELQYLADSEDKGYFLHGVPH